MYVLKRTESKRGGGTISATRRSAGTWGSRAHRESGAEAVPAIGVGPGAAEPEEGEEDDTVVHGRACAEGAASARGGAGQCGAGVPVSVGVAGAGDGGLGPGGRGRGLFGVGRAGAERGGFNEGRAGAVGRRARAGWCRGLVRGVWAGWCRGLVRGVRAGWCRGVVQVLPWGVPPVRAGAGGGWRGPALAGVRRARPCLSAARRHEARGHGERPAPPPPPPPPRPPPRERAVPERPRGSVTRRVEHCTACDACSPSL